MADPQLEAMAERFMWRPGDIVITPLPAAVKPRLVAIKPRLGRKG